MLDQPQSLKELELRFAARKPMTHWRFDDAESVCDSLRLCIAAGRADIAYSRLLEGHVNALQIISRYGHPELVATVRRAVAAGAWLGCWNNDNPTAPLTSQGHILSGSKTFCSGQGLLTHAIVSSEAANSETCQLWLLDLSQPHEVDESWWDVRGMSRTRSHAIHWRNAEATPIGQRGDYQIEPFFSAGAIRFAACHAGGIARLHDLLRRHLVDRDRADHPLQRRRLSESWVDTQAAIATVMQVGRHYDAADPQLCVRVHAARHAVLEIAERQVARIQRAVGTRALFTPDPISEAVTDLMMYIRQPNPDGSVAEVGQAVVQSALDFTL